MSNKKSKLIKPGDVVFIRDSDNKIDRSMNYIFLRFMSIQDLMLLSEITMSKDLFSTMRTILGKTAFDDFDCIIGRCDQDGFVNISYSSIKSLKMDLLSTIKVRKQRNYKKFLNSVLSDIEKDLKDKYKKLPKKLKNNAITTSK